MRLGSVCRALRIKKRWRQADLAERAGVARTTVSDLETGHIERTRVDSVVRMVEALGGRIDFAVRWHGGELDRLLNARHSALHESVARTLRTIGGWQIAPEVSFNTGGEKGAIDILAWHPATRTLLVIELKTSIVDISDLMGTLDRKRRLASVVSRPRGWYPATVAVWLVVGDSATNRRRVSAHAKTLRAALPSDGRTISGWLRQPHGELRCLSFWANAAGAGTKSGFAVVRGVRKPRTTSPRA